MEDFQLSASTIRRDLDLPFDGSNNEEHVFNISLEKDQENEAIVEAEKKSEDDLQNEMASIKEKLNEDAKNRLNEEGNQESVQERKTRKETERRNKKIKQNDIKCMFERSQAAFIPFF